MTQTKIITKSAPFYYEMLSAIKFNEKYYLDMIYDATTSYEPEPNERQLPLV